MSRTLFVGCSHTSGYFYHDTDGWGEEKESAKTHRDGLYQWALNNYAEIYAKDNNQKTIIYAFPGAGNCKYPDWIRYCLNTYDDIDSIFVQSTYWNRYQISANLRPDLDSTIDIDHYVFQAKSDELVTRYTDKEVALPFLEIMRQPNDNDYDNFSGHKFPGDGNFQFLEQLDKRYEYTKLWNELLTPLQTKNYHRDLVVIDTMCRDRGIPWYIWNMKDDCQLPPDLNLYGELKMCVRSPMSAEKYLLEKLNINMKEHKIDVEHHPILIHNLIAKHYIPWLKNLTKT